MQEFISNHSSCSPGPRFLQWSMLLMALFFLTTCQKEENAIREYPRLANLQVTEINASGAVFNAEVIAGNLDDVIEYGFVWNTIDEPQYGFPDKQVTTKLLNEKKFSAAIHSALKTGERYYVRAFIKTERFLVYGETISFISLGSEAPILTDFSPKTASWGDTLKIIGKNFTYKSSGINVQLGNIQAPVLSSTDTTIQVVVPSEMNLEKVNLSVSIVGNTAKSENQFAYLVPQISDIHPLSATYKDTVYIHGINFFRNNTYNKVNFNGMSVPIVFASTTLLKVLVPVNLAVNHAKISIAGPTKAIEFDVPFALKVITIKGFQPDTVFHSNEIITITGENFNPNGSNNKVTIKGLNVPIIEASAGQLKVKIPSQILPLPYYSLITNADIVVTTGQQAVTSTRKLEIYMKSWWTKKKDFPGVSRNDGVGFSIGSKGYFGLGDHYPNIKYNDFWEYDPQADLWTQKPDFPGEKRSNTSFFVLNSEGYVGLGVTYQANEQVLFKDFYKYNPNTEEWTKTADFPGSPRHSAASFVKDGKAFVGTGYIKYENPLPYNQLLITSDFWSFNPQNEQWNEVQNFPYETWKAVGLTIENAGYVFEGGKIKEYTGNLWTDRCTVSYTPYLPDKSFTIGSIGYIAVVGVNILGFDSKLNQIKPIPGSVPMDVLYNGPSIFVINKKAYIVGGGSYGNSRNTVWEFDPSQPISN